jgi:hypothetical protein
VRGRARRAAGRRTVGRAEEGQARSGSGAGRRKEKGRREREERKKERRKEKKKRKKKRKEKKKRKIGKREEKGKEKGKEFRELGEILGKLRGREKGFLWGFPGFSGAGVIPETTVMARRAGRWDSGKSGILDEVADSGAGAAHGERLVPEQVGKLFPQRVLPFPSDFFYSVSAPLDPGHPYF